MTNQKPAPYMQMVGAWHKEGLSLLQIRERLQQQGLSEDTTEETIKQWKKVRFEKKRASGFLYCGIGGGLLFTSFLITLILFDTEHSFLFYLYGLTLIGITVVLKGMVDLLGW